MAIFTPAQKTALLALINSTEFAGLVATPVNLLAALNAAPAVANPSPRGTVPRPFVMLDLINAVAVANRPGLAAWIVGATQLVIAQDTAHLIDGINTMVGVSALAPADGQAMIAVISSTIADPSWPATVPGPTPFQGLFPGAGFTTTDGSTHVGTCTPDMLTEVLS